MWGNRFDLSSLKNRQWFFMSCQRMREKIKYDFVSFAIGDSVSNGFGQLYITQTYVRAIYYNISRL